MEHYKHIFVKKWIGLYHVTPLPHSWSLYQSLMSCNVISSCFLNSWTIQEFTNHIDRNIWDLASWIKSKYVVDSIKWNWMCVYVCVCLYVCVCVYVFVFGTPLIFGILVARSIHLVFSLVNESMFMNLYKISNSVCASLCLFCEHILSRSKGNVCVHVMLKARKENRKEKPNRCETGPNTRWIWNHIHSVKVGVGLHGICTDFRHRCS